MRCPMCKADHQTFQVQETDPVLGVCTTKCEPCGSTVVLDITPLRALRNPHHGACSLRHGGPECTCNPPF